MVVVYREVWFLEEHPPTVPQTSIRSMFTVWLMSSGTVRFILGSLVFPVYKLEVVRASEGDESVVLPFKTKTRLPQSATVEWRRIDSDMVLHVHPDGQSALQNCTEMKENPLRSGDLSLTLYSPHHTDSGLYVCTVHKGKHNLKQKVVSVTISGQSCKHHRCTAVRVQTLLSYSNSAAVFWIHSSPEG